MPSSTSSFSNTGAAARKAFDSSAAGVAHHALDAGAVVPRAVEQHDVTCGREVRDVALEVPLPALGLGRLGQRDEVALAWIEVLADRVDRPALAGAVAPFEQHHDARAGDARPAREADQLALHGPERGLVVLAVELAHSGASSKRSVANTRASGNAFKA
jgi:hypothetical protein